MLEMNCHHLRVQMFFMRTHPPPHREPGVQIPWGSGKTQTRSPGSTQLRLGNSCPPTGLYCLPALATAVSSSHLAWSPHQRPSAGLALPKQAIEFVIAMGSHGCSVGNVSVCLQRGPTSPILPLFLPLHSPVTPSVGRFLAHRDLSSMVLFHGNSSMDEHWSSISPFGL